MEKSPLSLTPEEKQQTQHLIKEMKQEAEEKANRPKFKKPEKATSMETPEATPENIEEEVQSLKDKLGDLLTKIDSKIQNKSYNPENEASSIVQQKRNEQNEQRKTVLGEMKEEQLAKKMEAEGRLERIREAFNDPDALERIKQIVMGDQELPTVDIEKPILPETLEEVAQNNSDESEESKSA